VCSSLHANEDVKTGQVIGILSSEPYSSTQYVMHTIESFQPPVPKQSLQQLLSRLSRHERIRIAAALACGVIQLCGSWFNPHWNSSDIHLAVSSDNESLLDFFLTWSLSEPVAHKGRPPTFHPSTVRRDTLVPLGCAVVELSIGKSMAKHLLTSEDKDEDVTKFDTASKLVETALYESGSNYADAVRGCLFWSDKGSLCSDDNSFQERVFNTIVSPLLRDLAQFEDISIDLRM
jgi:hypothetical protein